VLECAEDQHVKPPASQQRSGVASVVGLVDVVAVSEQLVSELGARVRAYVSDGEEDG
jgi:hypothetical protein